MRHHAFTRRSSIQSSVRVVLALLVAALGYFIVTRSLAEAVARRDPAQAHRLAPENSRITARLAASLMLHNTIAGNPAQAERLSREALRQDPTAVTAVSTLGMIAQLRGDTAAARRRFAYAEALSRRDFPTQLWAIEDSVEREDIIGALRHYDIALRTSPGTADLLFPVLASAASDRAIRVALIRTLAAKPSWSDNFLGHVAVNGPDPRSTAQLFLGLGRAGVVVPEAARADAINALIAGGMLDQAWTYYAAVHPGVQRAVLRDPHFTAAIETPSQFDWNPINATGITTSIQRGERGGVFDFAASATVGGPLLQQLQLLPPGDYHVIGRSSGIDQPDDALPYWVLSCRNGRDLDRIVLPNSAQANGTFSGRFHVPNGCPAQILALIAQPSDSVTGLSGQIVWVRLTPTR